MNVSTDLQTFSSTKLSEKLKVGKDFVDDYFKDVEDRLSLKHLPTNNDIPGGWDFENKEYTTHIDESLNMECIKRQQLLDLMVGGIKLDECCIKVTVTHGRNRGDGHMPSCFHTTHHFNYNKRLTGYWNEDDERVKGLVKRFTSGNAFYGYTGSFGLTPVDNNIIERWTLDDSNTNKDEVYSFILFGMMLDCMNSSGFHFQYLQSWSGDGKRLGPNKLEYEYKHPITDKVVGASLWRPYGKTTLKNKLPIIQLKELIDEYNELPSSYTPKK